MKGIMVMLLTAVALTSCSDQDISNTMYSENSQKIAQNFMTELSAQLKQQIESDGVESAIPVCKNIAPALAAKYSQNGALVKRVSNRARNTTQGTPDEWEQKALLEFDSAIKLNPSNSNLEKAELITEPNGRYYRYAKAITVKPLCLNCHGSNNDIKPSVLEVIRQEYPNDIAIGYKVGDLRGAISIKQEIID